MKRAYINGILLDGTQQMEPQAHKVLLCEDGVITADTAGRYLLTNQNLKFANINWTFFIAGGVVVVLIGIAYVVLKKRYWFW